MFSIRLSWTLKWFQPQSISCQSAIVFSWYIFSVYCFRCVCLTCAMDKRFIVPFYFIYVSLFEWSAKTTSYFCLMYIAWHAYAVLCLGALYECLQWLLAFYWLSSQFWNFVTLNWGGYSMSKTLKKTFRYASNIGVLLKSYNQVQ